MNRRIASGCNSESARPAELRPGRRCSARHCSDGQKGCDAENTGAHAFMSHAPVTRVKRRYLSKSGSGAALRSASATPFCIGSESIRPFVSNNLSCAHRALRLLREVALILRSQ